MLASYTFNSSYHPPKEQTISLPGLRLLEGGNFQPGDYAPIVMKQDQSIRLKFFQWNGFDPNATEDIKPYLSASHVLSSSEYSSLIRQHRCLIPVDAYYVTSGKGLSYKVSSPETGMFCFAGIYREWKDETGTMKYSFAILSTQACADVSPFGLLMPLILRRQEERIWLNTHAKLQYISRMLYQPCSLSLAVHPVYKLLEASETYPKQIAA
ncbi:MAG: SOS response-associated peptidase family protein [Bacteroidota bacterium]